MNETIEERGILVVELLWQVAHRTARGPAILTPVIVITGISRAWPQPYRGKDEKAEHCEEVNMEEEED